MVVGKTAPSLSLAEIFNYVSETEVLSSVFPDINSLPTCICSPLRVDRNPSFSIYVSASNHVRFKDFATGESGGLLDLLCEYWNCSFQQCLGKIGSMFISGNNVTIKPKSIRTFTRKEHNHLTDIQVVIRPWHDYDYQYWSSYGVEPKWLHYAEIYPISYKIVTKREHPKDKGVRYIFPADKLAYVYVERKDGRVQLKIYQPLNTKGFKWCSKMDASVIGLWTKIPEYGDRVIICSSIKDALCISSQLHIPTLCLQGEGYNMSATAVSELKRRYKRVFISFDVDAPGKADAEKLASSTGFINIVPNLKGEKDYSDYYKSLTNKKDFQQLKILFT